jgi:hypothetical protein
MLGDGLKSDLQILNDKLTSLLASGADPGLSLHASFNGKNKRQYHLYQRGSRKRTYVKKGNWHEVARQVRLSCQARRIATIVQTLEVCASELQELGWGIEGASDALAENDDTASHQ